MLNIIGIDDTIVKQYLNNATGDKNNVMYNPRYMLKGIIYLYFFLIIIIPIEKINIKK